MFLQKSLLKFSSAVVHTQDFRVLAIRVNVILKHKQSVLDVKYQSKPITARQSLRRAKWIDRAYPGFRSTKRLHVEVFLLSPEWDTIAGLPSALKSLVTICTPFVGGERK